MNIVDAFVLYSSSFILSVYMAEITLQMLEVRNAWENIEGILHCNWLRLWGILGLMKFLVVVAILRLCLCQVLSN